MTSRNPTFIVSNGKGSSYLFRTIIPQDLRHFLNNSKEIRVSLLTGLKIEAIRIAQVLKIKADFIFEDIRSGNNSMTCVVSIKRELKAHLIMIKTNGYNGERVTKGSPPPYLTSKIKLPMEQKLVADYVTKLKYKDIIEFCENNDIEFEDEDFPRAHIRRARQKLIKKIGEDIGYQELATELARDILIDHLSNLDFDGFKKFFNFFKIDDSEIMEIYNPLGDMSIEQLVSLLEENNDIIPIAKKIGVRRLFASNKFQHEDESKTEPVEKLWNGLKTNGNQVPDLSDNDVSEKDNSLEEKPGKVQKISKVAEEYFEEMKVGQVWNSKSELEKRTAINKLIEIVGDIRVDKLSHEVARKYKRILMKLPSNMRKDKRYRDLSIKEIIKLKDVKPIASNTVNNNLSTIIAFASWGRKHGYLSENFFEGMKVTNKKKAQDERKPFSDEDLIKIFDPEKYLRETAESSFRYWVPLLGLFTGARINELCQLHVSDIKIVDELWCLDINDDGDSKNSKKLKNKSSARVIPIHPKLIELGLIEFVNHQKNSKVVRLFPELTLRIDGFYRKPGRWFNESYLRKKVGIKDPDKTFHSLRHTVINGLKQKGVGESYISDYVGHSSGESETFGRYGKQYEPIALFEKVVNWIEYRLDVKKLRG
jgi:integrase